MTRIKIAGGPGRAALLFVCIVLWAFQLAAQSESFRFRQLTVADGLSGQYINCVFQDSRGYLWIGTDNGLNQYDGYQFNVYEYNPLDTQSLSSNWVRALGEDEQGNLWAGTENGLNRWDPGTGKFRRYFHEAGKAGSLADNHIFTLRQGREGGLWIGTKAGGLNRYDPATGGFEYFNHTTDSATADDAVKAILEDEQGMLWLGTWNSGLFHFDPASGRSIQYVRQEGQPHSLSSNAVWALAEDGQGRLWVGTYGGGLNLFDPETGTFTVYHRGLAGIHGLSHDVAWTLSPAEDGRLWVGTNGGGLNLFDPKTGGFQNIRHEPGNPFSLSNDAVRVVYKGQDGLLWAGTNNGLNYVSPRSAHFLLYQQGRDTSNGLSSNSVWSLHQGGPGRLWVGTFNGAVHQLDLASGRFQPFFYEEGSGRRPVYALQERREGGLWVGTFGDGLHLLPQEGDAALHFRNAANDTFSLSSNAVLSLLEDAEGVLWAGTYTGLNRLEEGTGQFLRYSDGPNGDAVWDIEESKDGHLWLATNAGLKRFDPETETFRRYHNDASGTQKSLSHNAVRSVCEDSRGWIWAGTRNGLNRLLPDERTVETYHVEDGLPSNIIYGILEDEKGQIWISTANGLSRLNPYTGRFYNFGVQDGLQGASFNVGAYCRSPFSGELFFGGDNGFNAFNPEDIQVDTTPPPIVVTAIKAFRPGEQEASRLIRNASEEKLLHFSFRDNILTFEFAALSYSKPDKNRYAYQLEGLSDHWVMLGGERKLTFTNLSPGDYIFRVKGANGDGVWNEEGAIVRFAIIPPWWQSTWAKGLYLLVLAATLWLIYRWRTRRQRRRIRWQQKELEREKQVSERLRQVDRLKDQFLANTSHELRTPLQGIIGLSEGLYDRTDDRQSRESLAMVISSGKRLNSLINDILDFSKLKNFDLEINTSAVGLHTLAEVVLRSNQPLIRGKPLQLVNAVAESLPTVRGDENRLQQVLYNLVGNAIKFTEQGHIKIGARQRDGDGAKMLEVFVEDTGIGIPESKREAIFQEFEQADSSITREYTGTGLGLSISKKLVELHGGAMWAESEVGKGSTFFFTLPVSGEPAATAAHGQPVARTVARLPSTEDGGMAETAPSPEAILNTGGEENRIRILVVDDEPVNQQVLKGHLSAGAYDLVQAMNGEEAIRCLNSEQAFDLVLLDVMMPRMSGYEVCRQIREKYLPSELPVIMVTAKNQVEDLVQGLALGANDYLAKPFSRAEFLARIQAHIDLHRIFGVTERFIPNEFIRTLGRQRITEIQLGDFAEREVTVFFSDIRDYTSLAERMSPEENYRFVNAYNGRMGPLIQQNRGFVNQYLGDAIMAIFTETPADALSAAIGMHQDLHGYNLQRREKRRLPIRIGVGLHTGSLIMGIIGDRKRMDAATISDTVNTASRIESLTKHYGANILLSQDSLDKIADKDAFHLRFLGRVLMKGKRDAVGIYECFDGDPAGLMERKLATLPLFEEGLENYLAGNFGESKKAFEEVVQRNADDAAARLLLNRIAHCLAHGIPEGWTGVEMMDGK